MEMAKLKLRIVDGIPEVDGDPNEIAEVLRQLSITTQSKQPEPQHEEHEILNIQDGEEIDEIDPEVLIKMIESNGEPITFSMGGLQKSYFGRRISSKGGEKQIYEVFRRAFDKARAQLESKYPDHRLASKVIHIDNIPTKRFTLVKNPVVPVQQDIGRRLEELKTQPDDEEVISL
jgi:hypothetical protein